MRYDKSDMASAVLKMGRLIIKEYSAYLKADVKLDKKEKQFRYRLLKELVILLKHIETVE